MSKGLKFVSLPALHHFTQGLTIRVNRCSECIDACLVRLNEKTSIPERIVTWNSTHPHRRRRLEFPELGRIIVEVNETIDRHGEQLSAAELREDWSDNHRSPALFINLNSPLLDIPMRVEIPLRAILKGAIDQRDNYVVYLHSLKTDAGDFVYYGITKRGWNTRLAEHMRSMGDEAQRRLFPSKLRDLIRRRIERRFGSADDGPQLTGVITSLCAVGLDEEAAMDVEEYLVAKYSLASDHPFGLNMIPGGKEGQRVLYRLAPKFTVSTVETHDREHAFEVYLRDHARLGTESGRSKSVAGLELRGSGDLWSPEPIECRSSSTDPVYGCITCKRQRDH